MKPWKSNALLAAGSLAVAWVIAELVLAVFFPMETVFLEVDPELGWRHAPGRKGYWHRELTEPQYVEINSLGHRDRERSLEKPPGTYRILMLGDSFCEGNYVPLETLVHTRLEAMLQEHAAESSVEVFNACVRGYGMAQEWLYLEREGMQFDPDAVLLMLDLGNDFYDSCHGVTPAGRPSFEWREGKLIHHPAQVSMLRRMALNYGLAHSHVLRLIYRDIVKRSRWGYQAAINLGLVFAHDQPASGEERLRIYRTGEAIVEQMEEFCRERGIRFFVFMFPIGTNLAALEHGRQSPPLLFGEKLSAFLKAQGIPHASAVERFEEQWKKGNRLHFLNGFGHWNEEGNTVVTEILFEHLKTWGLSGEGEAPAASNQGSGASFQ